MAEEFKSYDSTDEYKYSGARLTKDAEVRDTAGGKMVRLQVVSTSRNKGKRGIDDLWIDVEVADFFVEAASFMKQKDVLHEIRGKPYLRRYGDNNERFAICLERAQLVIPSELKKQLKERGWSGTGSPTSNGGNASSGTKSGSSGTKRTTSRRPQREIQELPED